ncbi:DUF1833 family protein [Hypericibacter sp.]|uniref:DUF1833 family protein n=1 Tax=Hypericibacter sp. TaxID=2705401 RepID=UPI003D6CF625
MFAKRFFPIRYFPLRYWPELPASTIPPSFARAAFAPETDEVFLQLLTIDHSSFSQPIRVVHNNEDVVSRGNLYTAYPFDITLPDDDGQKPPEVTVRIDNVARDIVLAIRMIPAGAPPTITLEVIMASTPNTVEAGPYGFTLRDVTADAAAVEGQITFEDILNESFPADEYTPASHPGLF